MTRPDLAPVIAGQYCPRCGIGHVAREEIPIHRCGVPQDAPRAVMTTYACGRCGPLPEVRVHWVPVDTPPPEE